MKMRIPIPGTEGCMVGSVSNVAEDALESPWDSLKNKIYQRAMIRLLSALADKKVLDALEICEILNIKIDEKDPPVFLFEESGK